MLESVGHLYFKFVIIESQFIFNLFPWIFCILKYPADAYEEQQADSYKLSILVVFKQSDNIPRFFIVFYQKLIKKQLVNKIISDTNSKCHPITKLKYQCKILISIPYRDGTIDIDKKLKYEDEYDVIFYTWNVWLLLLTDWRKLLKAVTELNWLLVQYSADLVLYFWNLQRRSDEMKERK